MSECDLLKSPEFAFIVQLVTECTLDVVVHGFKYSRDQRRLCSTCPTSDKIRCRAAGC